MRPPRPTDLVDGLLGFTGFFAAVFLGATVVCEVTGRPALGSALTLLALVLVLVVLLRRRARIARRSDLPRRD